MHNVTVYGMAQSVYTQIVLLVLAEKNVAYDLQEINVFSDQFVNKVGKLNPFGKIPILIHDGFKLYETSAITRYIDETFPGVALQPSDNKKRARMHQIIALLDAHAYSPIIWGLFVQQVSFPEQGKESNITIMEDALNKTAVCLAALTDLIGQNTYLASNELTLADLHAFPILHHLSLTTQGSGLMAESIYFRSWTERMRKNTSASHMFTGSPYNPS